MDLMELGIKVRTDDLKRGERDLDRFGKTGERTGGKVEKFGSTAKKSFGAVAVAVGAAVAAMASFGAVVREISQFETAISRLEAVSGASTAQMIAMRDIARDLGSTTEFSASQAADGLNFLAMAGFNATEAMESLPAVLDLATASGMGLAQSADIASNVISGFGMAAADAANVADILAAASSRANTDVSQLGAAMSTVAPIAASLDMGIADTAAAIGLLSDAGIQGERAGTALRGVMAALAGPTTEAAGILKSLGLTIEDVNPATNDLATVMGRLDKAGLSTADAMKVFGREAASGALVLVDAAGRLGEFGDELGRVDGAAAEMAETMRDNLGGDIKGLQSAVSGLMLSLGDAGLTSVLRGVVSVLTVFVQGTGAIIDVLGRANSALFSFMEIKNQQQLAIDNVTLAMGDEINQANALFTLMGTGTTMTQSATLAKLSEAESHMRNANSIREEKEETIALQQAQLTIDYQRQIDALQTIRQGTDAYEDREQSIARVLSRMGELQNILQSTNGDFADAQAEVDRIRAAIDSAVDGMVTFGGEVISAKDLTDRLASAADGVSFTGAAASAQVLADTLGIALSRALALSTTTPAMADEDLAMAVPVIPGAPQREQNRNAVSNIGSILDTEAAKVARKASSGGGGGGGGMSDAARESQRIDNEMKREAERVISDLRSETQIYNDELRDLSELQEMGYLSTEQMSRAAAQLTEEFQQAQWDETGVGAFIDDLSRAAMNAENLGDVFTAQIRRMATEWLSSGLTTLVQGFMGGGNPLVGLFGGGNAPSFDGGGFTGSGARSGGLDGRGGFMAMLHPQETVIDHTRGQRGGSDPVQVVVRILPSGEFDARVEGTARAVVRVEAPRMIGAALQRGKEQRAFR